MDVFIVNEAEATQLTGAPEGTAPATLLEHLHTRFPSADLVVTAGELGSIALLSGTQYAQEAFPVTVIDTTGAGDTFCGYFLAAACAAALRRWRSARHPLPPHSRSPVQVPRPPSHRWTRCAPF